jgi:hypothetical protein
MEAFASLTMMNIGLALSQYMVFRVGGFSIATVASPRSVPMRQAS